MSTSHDFVELIYSKERRYYIAFELDGDCRSLYDLFERVFMAFWRASINT